MSLRPLVFGILAAVSVGLSGCKGPCRQLSERLCECERSTFERENCLQDVSTKDGSATVTADDEAFCQSKLEVCDCNALDTVEGKRNCGLVRESAPAN
jgi:hypothetical protein